MKTGVSKILAMLLVSSVLALSACKKDEAASSPKLETPVSAAKKTDDPVEAVSSVLAKFKENDLAGVAALALPPAKLDELRTKWKEKSAKEPPSEEERAEFAAQIAMFTAPDAEANLYAMLEPQLAKFESEYAAQLPMFIGMGQGFAMQAINENQELSESQKKQAIDAISALAGWAQSAKFGDRELAKKGIGIAVKTVRSLELKTLDDVAALEFDALLGKGGVMLGGIKQILALYNFDIDAALASAKPKLISQDGDTAKVGLTYNFLGKELSSESELVKVDGRWYGKEAMADIFDSIAGGDDDSDESATFAD
jgi:hypothetical protein